MKSKEESKDDPNSYMVIILKSNMRMNKFIHKFYENNENKKEVIANEQNKLKDLRGYDKKVKLTVKYINMLKNIFKELVKF